MSGHAAPLLSHRCERPLPGIPRQGRAPLQRPSQPSQMVRRTKAVRPPSSQQEHPCCKPSRLVALTDQAQTAIYSIASSAPTWRSRRWHALCIAQCKTNAGLTTDSTDPTAGRCWQGAPDPFQAPPRTKASPPAPGVALMQPARRGVRTPFFFFFIELK